MKNKLLKIFLSVYLLIGMIGVHLVDSSAASFSVKASSSSVSPGGSFTVTISASGAGQFSVSASNGTVSSSSVWVDGSATVSVKAGKSGKTTVSVTAVDATGNDETPITGTKSVSVSITQPKPTTPSKPSNSGSSGSKPSGNTSTSKPQEQDNRSKDNNLASLSISNGELSPAFAADKTDYKVSLTSETAELTINAKAKDTKATVSGTGKHALKIGSQTFAVTVTAENGAKKVYSITVDVVEKPTQFVDLDGEKLGILKDVSKAEIPSGYKSTTTKLGETEIEAWTHEKMGLTLAYLMDEKENKNLYILNDGKVTQKYEELPLNGKTYVPLIIPDDLKTQQNLTQKEVQIGELTLKGWIYIDKNHSDFVVVYLLNEDGTKGLYSYDNVEGTIQRYIPSEEKESFNYFMITTGVFALTTIGACLLHFNFRRKSVAAIKEYYEKKG
jgi:hypothetical protein